LSKPAYSDRDASEWIGILKEVNYAIQVRLKQANGCLRDRATPAVSPTRRLMVWILSLKYFGTPQKTRLPAPRRMISKKHQCSIGPV
jgi:hypothetical protein